MPATDFDVDHFLGFNKGSPKGPKGTQEEKTSVSVPKGKRPARVEAKKLVALEAAPIESEIEDSTYGDEDFAVDA
jgi:hypothetical protein